MSRGKAWRMRSLAWRKSLVVGAVVGACIVVLGAAWVQWRGADDCAIMAEEGVSRC